MNITVLGGGHGCYAAAVEMAEKGKIRGQYYEEPAERKDSFPVVDFGV